MNILEDAMMRGVVVELEVNVSVWVLLITSQLANYSSPVCISEEPSSI